MERISRHISYSEASHSNTANRRQLDNAPNDTQLAAMKLLADKVFEPLRNYLREPIMISSFFRTATVNAAVGGSSTSQHLLGEAMDIQAPDKAGYSNADIFYYILNKLDFDQLIWEFGDNRKPAWVHVSYSATTNRKQVLRAVKINGKIQYLDID